MCRGLCRPDGEQAVDDALAEHAKLSPDHPTLWFNETQQVLTAEWGDIPE